MGRRHLYRKTPDQIAWDAIEGTLSMQEAAIEFVQCDWGDVLFYVISGGDVVEELAYFESNDTTKHALLEEQVRIFFWNWVGSTFDPERDVPPSRHKTYPL